MDWAAVEDDDGALGDGQRAIDALSSMWRWGSSAGLRMSRRVRRGVRAGLPRGCRRRMRCGPPGRACPARLRSTPACPARSSRRRRRRAQWSVLARRRACSRRRRGRSKPAAPQSAGTAAAGSARDADSEQQEQELAGRAVRRGERQVDDRRQRGVQHRSRTPSLRCFEHGNAGVHLLCGHAEARTSPRRTELVRAYLTLVVR